MVVEIKEFTYKGIYLELVKDQGWKCNLGGEVYLFPHCQAAEAAIDDIFWNVELIATDYNGVKLK